MVETVLELQRYQASVLQISDEVTVYLLRYPRTLFCRITCIEVSVRTGRMPIQRTFDAVDNGWNTRTFAGPNEVRRFVTELLLKPDSLIAS